MCFGIYLGVCIEEIKVVVAIALTLVDELGVIPWQEYDWILRFDVLGMCLFI